MHERFAQLAGEHISYDRTLAPLDGFSEILAKLAGEGLKGANVTVPFKEDAFHWVHELSHRAHQAGAVNTLIKTADGHWLGDNTDGVGLVADLCRLGFDPRDKTLLVLGAGGATRGILGPILDRGPKSITVANRTPAKALSLADVFGIEAAEFEQLHGRRFDIVINATSASLSGQLPALPSDVIASTGLAYDLAYGPRGTTFTRWAASQGCPKTADGLGMLVAQGAESYYLWRGVRPDWQKVLGEMEAQR
ncbi:shikimate dehydrogenase [Gallaecimonas sp. GXIMD4217]|uniref:shikimate dehydrogenase n=1 Tax=Gallaecimonas sp. GXIMD4217 TaxID=3131927 RepID=UPI00311AF034